MPAARSPMDGRNAYDDVRWRTTSAIHHLLASPPNPHRKTHRMPVSWCTIEADGDEAMRSSVRFIMGGITYGRALAHHQKVVLNGAPHSTWRAGVRKVLGRSSGGRIKRLLHRVL